MRVQCARTYAKLRRTILSKWIICTRTDVDLAQGIQSAASNSDAQSRQTRMATALLRTNIARRNHKQSELCASTIRRREVIWITAIESARTFLAYTTIVRPLINLSSYGDCTRVNCFRFSTRRAAREGSDRELFATRQTHERTTTSSRRRRTRQLAVASRKLNFTL